MLSDRLFFPLMLLVALVVIALAAVWPQGEGARSPGPFGHIPTQQTPEAKAAAAREAARINDENSRSANLAKTANEAAARARATLAP